jgi:hypothetical protein
LLASYPLSGVKSTFQATSQKGLQHVGHPQNPQNPQHPYQPCFSAQLRELFLLLLLLLPPPLLQLTAEEEYSPLCTFLETLLTMLW